MESLRETTEILPKWREVLRRQGRTMTWLAEVTGKTYPQVSSYAAGTAKTPPEWLAQVAIVLGERVA
jgi:hypothetical protein